MSVDPNKCSVCGKDIYPKGDKSFEIKASKVIAVALIKRVEGEGGRLVKVECAECLANQKEDVA